MKIFDPICFGECSLSNYIIEIVTLLVGILLIVILFGVTGFVIYNIGKFIKDVLSEDSE